MEPRLTVVTLGVSDIARARRFYADGLGWKPSSASSEHVVFFSLNGIVLSLFGRTELAADAHIDPGSAPAVFGGITLAHNVGSKAEVDAALDQAVAAGATLLKAAADTFWGGYSGYFTDPDGHPWEVAWNPHWPLGADGRVSIP
jgi:hypothetical protein